MKKTINQTTSTGVMMSYGTGRFLAEFLTVAYGIMAFFFYEKEMGLPAIYPTIATSTGSTGCARSLKSSLTYLSHTGLYA